MSKTREGFVKVPGYGEVREGLVRALHRKEYKDEREKEYYPQVDSDLRLGRFVKGMFTRKGGPIGFAIGASVDFAYKTVELASNRSTSLRWYEVAGVAGSTLVGAVFSGRENALEGAADDIEIAAMNGVGPESSERPPDVPRPEQP
jgi:hypothetical protein